MDDPEVLAALQRDASAAYWQARAASRSLEAACTTMGHALQQVAEDLSEALRLTRRLAATHQRMMQRLATLSSTTPPAETPAPVSPGPQGE
jgi:hypothetical protein